MSQTLTRDIRDVANEIHAREIKPAIDAYIAALTAIRGANDPDGPTVSMILACEAAAAKLKGAEGNLRAALFASMKDNGAIDFEHDGMIAAVRAGSTSATIKDETALRAAAPELFISSPDKLDRAALTKRLKAGMPVAGAELSTGAPTLVIRRA